jgi:hypothetical protein
MDWLHDALDVDAFVPEIVHWRVLKSPKPPGVRAQPPLVCLDPVLDLADPTLSLKVLDLLLLNRR